MVFFIIFFLGANGQVFKAVQVATNTTVAVKRINHNEFNN